MQPTEAEREAGILCYATAGPSCAGRVKSAPDDFHVEEVIDTSRMTAEWADGRYPLYRVQKESIDTMHMAAQLADVLKSRVSYGGMKDSRAVAVQYATPTSLRSERPAQVDGRRFRATLAGFVARPLSRSSVLANRFDVALRGCCAEVGIRISEAFDLASAGKEGLRRRVCGTGQAHHRGRDNDLHRRRGGRGQVGGLQPAQGPALAAERVPAGVGDELHEGDESHAEAEGCLREAFKQ